MESLELPMDLYWDGKAEPNSPSSELFPLSNTEESWCFGNDFAKNILFSSVNVDVDDDLFLDDSQSEDVVFEFEYDVKNEQWLDVKQSVPPIDASSYISQPHSFSEVQVVKLQNSELATELEKLCDVTELTQLTPPQTPPQTQTYIINEIFDFLSQQSDCNVADTAVIEDIIQATSPGSSYVDYTSDAARSPASSTDEGSEIIDEILRTKAQDLPDCNDEDSMYSNYSSEISQSTNESEWTPSPSPDTSKNGDCIKSSSTHSTLNGGISKKRVRPYNRNVEDKKSRKKEQNKNAATRYRQKKKQEMEEILEEERMLAQRHEELERTATEAEREVKYLKKLIKEFFKPKLFKA